MKQIKNKFSYQIILYYCFFVRVEIDESLNICFGHSLKHFPELIFSGIANLLVNITYDFL